MRTRRRGLAGAAAALAVAAMVVLIASQRVRAPIAHPLGVFAPCEWTDVPGRVECARVRVREKFDDQASRPININVLIARASTPSGAEPIFFFTGGPGSAASESAAYLAREFDEARQTRDLVFIDQRGTGGSSRLQCPRPAEAARRIAPMFDEAETRACLADLSRQADLSRYTTTDAARDVDVVRNAAGYDRIHLHGSSYGTRVAWLYAALYPHAVRSMILHGPAPPDFRLPLPFARGLDAALEGVVTDCESDADCRSRYPRVRQDLQRTFDGVRERPAAVTLDERTGLTVHASFGIGEVSEGLRYLLYTPGGARRVPGLLRAAAAGDYTPLARAAAEERRRNESLNRGMYLSVTCAEDLPFITETDLEEATAGTRLGDYRVRQQQRACAVWPRGDALPDAFFLPLEVPALLLVGEHDPATPPAVAERGMSLLPNGRLVVIPHAAHAFGGLGIEGCLARVMHTFVARGRAADVDASCVAAARRPPFF